MSGQIITRCRYCSAPLSVSVVDLGAQPYSNSFPLSAEIDREQRHPLHVRLCTACFLVQTDFDAPRDEIYSADYANFSSYSASWVAHARHYAAQAAARFELGADSMVVEIASNDGYLLQHFVSRSVPCLGVEPTLGTAMAAIEKGVPTEIAFFDQSVARDLHERGYAADLMAANNVLAHVPDIADFVRSFSILLKPDGVATFEFPHLLQLFRAHAFDTIYHEHFFYLSLRAVELIFADCGLRVFDIEKFSTHGGSLRVSACRHKSKREETRAVAATRKEEDAAGFAEPSGYAGLEPAVTRIKLETREFLERARVEGKRVAAYGAAAKGSTFLNTCNLTENDIAFVADANVQKQGRLMPGSHIPVVAPVALRALKPGYVLILPWNLKVEIVKQLSDMRECGTKFVTAVPRIEVVQ
jgi:SAM-dependent methyltransferase